MDNNYNFCENAPADFCFCFKENCATAGDCLRALAAKDLTTDWGSVRIINPLIVDPAGGSACAYYSKAEKLRGAYGFGKAMAQVPHGRAGSVRSAICRYVCLRNYYYLLRGKKPMFPSMQRTVSRIFQIDGGLTSPIEFDRYEWQYKW